MRILEGKTAVVTGAGKGIGKGIAIELARAGANVVINYAHSAKGAEEAKAIAESLGSEAMIYKADVSDNAQVEAMMKAAYEWHGKLDILVSNAALQTNLPTLEEYDFKYYKDLVNVNIGGYYACVREAAKYMKEQREGVMILISSVHARRVTQFDPVYGMTKGGIKMIEREVAAELSKYNVRCVCIEPGAVQLDAPKTGSVGTFSRKELIIPEQCLPKMNAYQLKGGTPVPKHVGEAVVFLASENASMISGCELQLDSAATLHI